MVHLIKLTHFVLLTTIYSFAIIGTPTATQAQEKPPNIVIIFIDDMGYADIGPFGAKDYKTPNLDQMAVEGMKLTDFHSATAVCSASRAALLTGCYPVRVGIQGALFPHQKIGLNPSEITLAEICKSKGYATACFGKWHLGHHQEFLPLQQGFDEYFGLPYSNDMWPRRYGPHDSPVPKRKKRYPNLPLYEGNIVVDDNVTEEDQAQLTTQYTERAVDFINRYHEKPFFLYLPHTMVHVPIFVSSKFKGKSGAGLYGDVVMELDWSVGQILQTLKKQRIDDNTLIIFTSDNGPWLKFGNHGGSAGQFREGKGTMFEGGYRVPCVARWPGKIPAETTCKELATTIDLLPTIAKLIDAKVPDDRIIDGKNIWPLLSGEKGAKTPHEVFYCYYSGQLRAVRDSRWKLHFPHTYASAKGIKRGADGIPGSQRKRKIGLALFDLQADPGETKNVAKDYPAEVARLKALADKARGDLGDRLHKIPPTNARKHGKAGS